MSKMSIKYRVMCYFVHATIHMYSKPGVIVCDRNTTVEQFRRNNQKILTRVFEEGLSIMNYELSHEQMNKGIASYLVSKYKPQSVFTSEVYKKELIPSGMIVLLKGSYRSVDGSIKQGQKIGEKWYAQENDLMK